MAYASDGYCVHGTPYAKTCPHGCDDPSDREPDPEHAHATELEIELAAARLALQEVEAGPSCPLCHVDDGEHEEGCLIAAALGRQTKPSPRLGIPLVPATDLAAARAEIERLRGVDEQLRAGLHEACSWLDVLLCQAADGEVPSLEICDSVRDATDAYAALAGPRPKAGA